MLGSLELKKQSRVGEKVLPLVNLSDHVVTLLQEFQAAWQLPPKLVRAIKPTWKPPNHDELKTIFDGPMFEDLQEAGIGVVVRNSHGEVMAALAKKIPMPFSVILLETLVARRVVLFVQELSFYRSIF